MITQKKKTTVLPLIKCVECDGNAYAIEVTFACEKCQTIVPVNSSLVCDHVLFSKADKENITEYIKNYIKRKAIFENSDILNTDLNNEDYEECYNHRFSLKPLEILKLIKHKYKLDSYTVVINTMLRNFIFILKVLDKLPGKEVYLVDEIGNKSVDIKKQLLLNIEKEYDKIKTKRIVDEFLSEIDLSSDISRLREREKDE